jgi:hypothetical protein
MQDAGCTKIIARFRADVRPCALYPVVWAGG